MITIERSVHIVILRVTALALTITALHPVVSAQAVRLTGQLLAADSNQPLANTTIVATSATRPVKVIEALTDSNGGFQFQATLGYPYLICSRATGKYLDSCIFSKPLLITAAADSPAVALKAVPGVRIRLRITDTDNLLGIMSGTPLVVDPLTLLAFAEEQITRTRIPLPIAAAADAANAVDIGAVLPGATSWGIAMSTVVGQLFDSSGQAYVNGSPIPRPTVDSGSEFLATFSLKNK
jgi:hypothetical protein